MLKFINPSPDVHREWWYQSEQPFSVLRYEKNINYTPFTRNFPYPAPSSIREVTRNCHIAYDILDCHHELCTLIEWVHSDAWFLWGSADDDLPIPISMAVEFHDAAKHGRPFTFIVRDLICS